MSDIDNEIDAAVTGLYDSLPFGDPLTLANPAAPAPKCRRHAWASSGEITSTGVLITSQCVRCGVVRDEVARRRNRNNARRGKRIQHDRIVALGGRNLPGNKQNHDGIGLAFSYESKSGKEGGVFSKRYWDWLKGIPVTAAQTAVLLVTEAGVVGRRARAYVVVDFDDWRDLHQEVRDQDDAIQPPDPYPESLR